MNDIHFALIGGAHPHSRAHLKTLQHLPEVTAITVADADESVGATYADEAKVTGVVTRLQDALDSGATHAFVCARNDRAPGVIEACARAGKHIIAEKPLAVNMAAFESARLAIEESGVTLTVVYQARLHPITGAARGLIKDGILGTPIAAEARMVTSAVRFRDPTHWLFNDEQAGGGILSWLGCHYLDLLAHLLDDEYASVSAHAESLGGEDIDVEDVAMLSLRFRGGALATMTAGYLLALSPAGYASGAYDTHIGVYGTKGRLWWDPVGDTTLHVESAHPSWSAAPRRELNFEVASSPAYGGVYGEEFVRQFIRASLGEGDPPSSLRDGVRVLELLDAAYRSAEDGTRETLD